jgi:hypothetical protein
MFLDPWKYILEDRESESKFGINLKRTLQQAVKAPLLTGLSIHVTKKVKSVCSFLTESWFRRLHCQPAQLKSRCIKALILNIFYIVYSF